MTEGTPDVWSVIQQGLEADAHNGTSKHFVLLRLCQEIDSIKSARGTGISRPEKIADISRHQHWFPRETRSEKRAQKFHTDDASLPRSG